MHNYGDSWPSWIVMAVWMIVFWGGLIALVLWSVTRLSRGSRDREAPRTAQKILDERFARGEIETDEYRQRRELLAH